jgi:two-component system KDP operon response regulator KdpE
VTRPSASQPLILVVQDEPELDGATLSAFAGAGFRTLVVSSRAAALARAAGHRPELVVVEALRSSAHAVEVAARLRPSTAAPIVALLGRAPDDERAILDSGIDDYVVWPFTAAEVLGRARVWLRQRAAAPGVRGPAAGEASAGRLRIDRERRLLFVDGREVHITPLECKLLTTLARQGGRSMTEEQILGAVWGPTSHPRPETLRAQMRRLRQKMERDPGRPRYLVTEVGGAYRLQWG